MPKASYCYFLFLRLLVLGCPAQVLAQGVTLSGRIIDHGQQPLPGVTIKLFPAHDSTALVVGVTGATGYFQVVAPAPGAYTLRASFVGFRPQTLALVVGQETPQKLPPISLVEGSAELAEVRVTASRPLITMTGDKVIVNVAQSTAASGSTALELLRRTPGVSVDQNGNLLLNGSSSVSVLLDGKLTYLSGAQVSQLLGGMSSSTINTVEISTTPGAQYDAAGSAGTITITTRKSAAPGYAATLSAGLTAGHYLLPQASVGGNVRTKHANWFGNASYSRQRRYQQAEDTQVGRDASGTPLGLTRQADNPWQTHYYTYKAGADFYLPRQQIVGFVYSGIFDDWSKDYRTTALARPSGLPAYQVLSRDYVLEPFYTNVCNANYQYKPDTTARLLTADADYIAYRNHSDGYLTSTSYDLVSQPLEPGQQLTFHQPSYIDIRSLKADGVLPTGSLLLKAGLKYAAASITNDFKYDSLRGGRFVFAPSLSNHFRYQERIAAAYVSGHRRLGRAELDAGLRVEHTFIDANSLNTGQRRQYDYVNFFPSLVLSQRLGAAHRLSLAANRRINRPNYTDLNPTRDYFDRYQLYQGNPNLVAETAWTTALTYTLRDNYSARLSYHRARNFIARSASIDPTTNALLLSRTNYAHRDRLEAQILAPFTLASFWNLSTSATLSYTAYPLPQGGGQRQVEKVAVDLYAAQTFRLPGGVTSELTTRYTSPTLNGVYVTRRYFSVDGGVKKSFYQNKLEARFAFSDLFHTAWYWGYSLSDAAEYTYRDVNDTRRFSLIFTYRLGGELNTGKQRRTDEEGRL